MEKAPLPAEVRRFILASIPSVPYLEAILLMRDRPDTLWDAQMIAARLYLPQGQAVQLLKTLQADGIAAADDTSGACRYRPSVHQATMLDRVATLYPTHLHAVTELIHSRMDKRARHFADAFRWRKD
jgi:hypothetical protein